VGQGRTGVYFFGVKKNENIESENYKQIDG
jgi:hypothetical protein